MGALRNALTGQLHTLDGHTLIGRGPLCQLRLLDPIASNDHASLTWVEEHWVIRDFSTNGTWLDGELIPKGRDIPIGEGARLSFGTSAGDWQLVDAHPPQPMVTPLVSGLPCFIVDGVIAVPRPEHACASIFQGSLGHWTLEVGDSVTPISPGGVFDANGTSWRFSCPTQWQPTVPLQSARLIAGSTFLFEVTSDEENVALTVDCGRELVSMGQSNTYYFLLTLARLKLQDEGRRTAAESGWVHREQLVRMLRCDPQLLNVWVCRIRAKFSNAGFLDYASVIERRDGSGRMRIGVLKNQIQSV